MNAVTMTKDETIRLMQAEIERLRELLREARDNFVADMTEAEWEMRVREALGD